MPKVAGALLVTLAMPQLSLVTGVPRLTVAKHDPASAATVMFSGHSMVGFSLSDTVIKTSATSQLAGLIASQILYVTVYEPIRTVEGNVRTPVSERLSPAIPPLLTIDNTTSAASTGRLFNLSFTSTLPATPPSLHSRGLEVKSSLTASITALSTITLTSA